MSRIHEVATINSKGQITLPKLIRQALGVDAGGKVAFDFNGKAIIALVESNGTSSLAEVHWYECHGIGKVKMKVKRWL